MYALYKEHIIINISIKITTVIINIIKYYYIIKHIIINKSCAVKNISDGLKKFK